MDPFADSESPVVAHSRELGIVVRLSKTASGQRTYTVGINVPADETPEPYVDALFEVERLVTERMDKPVKRASGPSLMTQLRRSAIVEFLRRQPQGYGPSNTPESDTMFHGWVTTAEIIEALGGGHRSQIVTDLKVLTEQGTIEYERGKGGNYPSRYRLAAEKKVSRAQKGGRA